MAIVLIPKDVEGRPISIALQLAAKLDTVTRSTARVGRVTCWFSSPLDDGFYKTEEARPPGPRWNGTRLLRAL